MGRGHALDQSRSRDLDRDMRICFVMMYMSTSVHLTRTNVAAMPLVLTLWAATLVPVIQDTQEMDLPVQVCKLKFMARQIVLKQ